eukprot:scaffold13133_cov20-Tisochrysis_lutea.AAC.1
MQQTCSSALPFAEAAICGSILGTCSRRVYQLCRLQRQPSVEAIWGHAADVFVRYESDPEMRDRFFYNALSGDGPAPVQCSPEVMSAVALQHTRSPSVWTVIPMQDIMALSARYHDRPAAEECINDPTNPKHYWRFRWARAYVHVCVHVHARGHQTERHFLILEGLHTSLRINLSMLARLPAALHSLALVCQALSLKAAYKDRFFFSAGLCIATSNCRLHTKIEDLIADRDLLKAVQVWIALNCRDELESVLAVGEVGSKDDLGPYQD